MKDWEVKVKIDKNIDDQYIVTELIIVPKKGSEITTGITSEVIRSIKMSDLLANNIDPDVIKIDQSRIDVWIESMKGRTFNYSDRISDYTLARLAYLYVHFVESGNLKPIKTISDELEVSRKAIVQRIQLARERGILTSATFLTAPRGKPLGKLTPKALELLNV
jgi:hypothetical protein